MAAYGYLQTTAKTLRRNRPLAYQQAIAAQGEHPLTGNWYPRWIPWTHPTDPVRAIMTRYTSTTGQYWGRIGGKSRSIAKATASRRNGLRHRPSARP